jgi:hypothetical protein
MTVERDDLVVHSEDPTGRVFRVAAVSTRQRFDVGGYAEAILSVVGHGVLRDGYPARQYRLATEEEKAAAREQGTLPAEAV